MINVTILEGDDAVDPEDWCRPLSIVSMSGGHSDYYSFTNQYTGAPENNAKWVKVKYILGKPWHGCTVSEIRKGLGKFTEWEFVRGDVPNRHREPIAKGLTDHSKVSYNDDLDDDSPF